MMIVCWPLTFLQQGQICTLMHLYGENVEKALSQNVLKTKGWNLQCIFKVIKPFSFLVTIKILSPKGYLHLPLGYIHV